MDSISNTIDDSDKILAMSAHALSLFFWFIPALIIRYTSDSQFVKHHADQAASWQIFLTLYSIASLALTLFFVGIIGLFILPLINLAFCTIGCVKAMQGEEWNYPATKSLFGDGIQKKRSEITHNKGIVGSSEDSYTDEELRDMYLSGQITQEELDKLSSDTEVEENTSLNN